jgi:hypothetical protein
MRTFHIGGTASRIPEQSTLEARNAGTARFQGLQLRESRDAGWYEFALHQCEKRYSLDISQGQERHE